jgi:hypothetical protein
MIYGRPAFGPQQRAAGGTKPSINPASKNSSPFFYGLIRHLGRSIGIAPVFIMDLPIEQVAPQKFLRLLRLI